MPTNKNRPQKNDVARRLAGIKKLFVAAETKSSEKLFDTRDGGRGVPRVPAEDALEEIATFANISNGVEAALSTAVTAFGGYSEAQFDGDVDGAVAEIHADVRALTNVALGLSPPSRAFFNKVLGGLVEVEQVAAPPEDGEPVAYPPLRVSLQHIDQHDVIVSRKGKNGSVAAAAKTTAGQVPRDVAREVDQILHTLQNEVWLEYMDYATSGMSTPFTARLTKPLNARIEDLARVLEGRLQDEVDELQAKLSAHKWKGPAASDWKHLQRSIKRLFDLIREF
jgi:hypothetical protein